MDQGGKELLVAVSFALAASEAVADRRSSYQLKRWEAYAMLHKKVDFTHLFHETVFTCTCVQSCSIKFYGDDRGILLLHLFLQCKYLSQILFRYLMSGGVNLDFLGIAN